MGCFGWFVRRSVFNSEGWETAALLSHILNSFHVCVVVRCSQMCGVAACVKIQGREARETAALPSQHFLEWGVISTLGLCANSKPNPRFQKTSHRVQPVLACFPHPAASFVQLQMA